MTKFLVILSILFLGFMMFLELQENEKTSTIPEFTEEQYEAICIEEELL